MSVPSINQSHSKDASGRGAAVIGYGLLLGSIMIVVTALLAVLVSALYLRHSANWVKTHLRYQIATVVWGIAGLALATLIWWGLGIAGATPGWAWFFGYIVLTGELVWLVSRCALGLARLKDNQPVGRSSRSALKAL